jgi:hypothetical protein
MQYFYDLLKELPSGAPSLVGARVPLRWNRNPLAFPSGMVAGFDPSHPLSKNIRFSGIASDGNFFNLLSNKPGTVVGAPSANIDAILGSNATFTNSTDAANFSGQSTVNDGNVTICCIVYFNSVSASQALFASSSVNTGWRFAYDNPSGYFNIIAGGVTGINMGIAPVANVPYFLAASASSTQSSVVLARLDTGKVTFATSTGASPVAPNGTYQVGNDTFSEVAKAKISTVMFSASFTSLQQLLQFAQDPWSFWYPRKALQLVSGAAAVVYPPAIGSTLPMIGVG